MTRKLTQEEAVERYSTENLKMIGKYVNNATKTEYSCKCGNACFIMPRHVLNGRTKSCGRCKRTRTRTVLSSNQILFNELYGDIYRIIPLTQGRWTIIDTKNLQLINNYTWKYHKNYVKSKQHDKDLFLHRLITNAPFDKVVDHIDGNPLNNLESNLRICSCKENAHNRKQISTNNTIGYKGLKKVGIKYQVYITNNSKQLYLGTFPTKKEAAIAYNNAAIKYFGEFARLNDITDEE